MRKNFAKNNYTFVQKILAVILLCSVLATTFLTADFGFGKLLRNDVKATIDGTITSFLDVPQDTIFVDAGISEEKIEFPKIIGAVVENEGLSKNVYFDASWECDSFSDKTALKTEYVFTLAETSLPAELGENVSLPTVKVYSDRYCIKGFKEISADLVAKAVTPEENVTFPSYVEAFVGDNTTAVNIRVNWSSYMETVEGGITRTFTDIGSKHSFKAEIIDTDQYYLSKELCDINIAAYTIPVITVYVISSTVAYVGGDNGFSNISEAYALINQNGGSGTIVINDFYEYFVSESEHDPSYVVVKNQGDNYSDSFFHEPAHRGMIVIKGNTPNAVLKLDYRYYALGDLMFKDITLQTGVSMKERIYANGYDLVMGTGITCTWGTELSEGYAKDYCNALRIYGGSATTDLKDDTRIVLLSGDYYLVRGGNEEGGTIDGNTFVYLGGTAHTYYQLMGGSRRGTITGSSYTLVNGNAVADAKSGGIDEEECVAVFGGGLEGTVNGDFNFQDGVDGGCHSIINGGTLNAAVTGSGAFETYNGKTFVTVCGDANICAGTQGAVFGVGDGSLGTIAKNDVLINIFCNAKLNAKDNVYANVYGSNTTNNVESNITTNVFDNAFVEGSVNGGTFVVGSGIGYEGNGKNTYVNIYGSAYIRLNVYGGSLRKGVNGDTFVTVTENATVKGNVYGGGQGAASVSVSNEYGFAKNTSVYIEGNVNIGGDVFGGGNYGYNSGNSSVIVKNAIISLDVYGGSQHGGTLLASTVELYNSKVQGNVYGGNKNRGIIYPETSKSFAKIKNGSYVVGSVYGGGMNSGSYYSNAEIEDAFVKGNVYGGSENEKALSSLVEIKGNTTVNGNVYGAGKNADVSDASVLIHSGFINDIYGGGETGYAENVKIIIDKAENPFLFDVKGNINGLPQSPASTEEIAGKFNSGSVYVLAFTNFKGTDGENNCGTVKSVKNFSSVKLISSTLTFKDTEGEYFEGITELTLDGSSVLDLPEKATICSAFTQGGVYSTSRTNVLPSSLYGVTGSKIYMPARALTDDEEIAHNGKVSSVLTVYGKITGNIGLYTRGEKKSGTYVTSFEDGSFVGGDIETPTNDYFYKDRNGQRAGHNRNFHIYMADGYNTGAFVLDGIKDVHNSGRVFTTLLCGGFGTLDEKNTANWTIWEGKSFANISIAKEGEDSIDGATSPLGGVEFTVYADKECTTALETVTTNENGIAFTKDFPADGTTYYVKETKTLADYTLDNTVYSVTLTFEDTGKTIALTDNAIINHLKFGEISLYKYSDDEKLLEGVSFLVTGPDGFAMTIVTDEFGFASTGKILYGTYTVKEVANPNPGFIAPDFVKEVVIEDGNTAVTLYPVNNRVTGKVTLTKVDENGKALEGVKFNVFADENLEKLVDTIITNADGYGESKALTIYGENTKYYVVEAVTLKGYILRNDVFEVTLYADSPVGVVMDGNDRVIVNYFEKATIAISKKGENDALLEGVEFGIYSDEACTSLVGTLKTDVSGSAISDALVLGTYFVKELFNPDLTYVVSEQVYRFDLVKNEAVYTETIYNVKSGAYISLEKVDSYGKSMEGVKFEIRNASGEVVDVIVTDENGRGISKALVIRLGEENLFTVKEISAPDYVYINDTIFEAVITKDNEVFELNGGEPIVNQVKEGVITLEKTNETGKPLSNVEFTIYADANCTEVVGTIITDEKGVATSQKLIFGTYYVKETNNPDKSYVVTNDVWKVEIDENNKTAKVNGRPIVNFHATGCISINKVDENGNPVEGVEFTIFDEGMNPLSKVYTDKNGKVTTCSLSILNGDRGTIYYVVETAAPEQYLIDETRYEAVLKTNGQVFALNGGKAIVNNFKKGQISITKESEDGKPLAGVEFTIYADSECTEVIETIVTKANGKALSSSLKLGTYFVKETKTVGTFVPTSAVWKITLDENGVTKELTSNPVVNFYSRGCISIIKVDEDGKPVAGVEFTIYDENMNELSKVYTGKDGKVTTCNLVISDINGTKYYVAETSAPDEYVLDSTKYEAILKTNGEVFALNGGKAIVNNFKKGQISITKESEDGKPLAGVEFTIYSDSECTKVIETVVTKADGKALSSSLKLGTYFVKETKTVGTFVPTSAVWTITLDENGVTKELTSNPIVNFYSRGCISIIKVDEDGKPVAGVEFTIYDENMNELSKVYTGKDGKVTTCNLVISDINGTKYYVAETSAPDKYVLDSTKYEAILKTNGEVFALNGGKAIVNNFKKGQISITKESEDGKPLAGVEFTIYADRECKEAVATIITDSKGKAVSPSLKLGTYFVKETKTNAPFVPVAHVWTITLDENGATKELTSTPIINYYSKGQITLTKTDDKGNALAGVEFTIYTLSGDVVDVITTNENGIATSKLLSVNSADGTVYVVKETKGLFGYEMDETPYNVLVKEDGEVVAVNGGKAIVNKKLVGNLSVTYKSENDSDNQEVVVNVTVNGNAYVGKYTQNGIQKETTDGKITVKNNDVFVIELDCGDSYVVTAETDVLVNLVSVTYNGVEADKQEGELTEDNLVQNVVIIADFVPPAKPGDKGAISFFCVLSALSAFGIFVLQSKKNRRGI